MEDQWQNLRLLADIAVSLSETKKIKHKKRKADFWTTEIPKKKRTSVTKKARLVASFLEPRNKKKTAISTPKDIPAALKDRILIGLGGQDLQLVLKKPLCKTDVSRGHGRLSMPVGSLTATFLEEDEVSRLRDRSGLEVLVVDEALREYSLCLKQWKMGKTDIFNLTSAWNSLVENNSLGSYDVVQLWSFRRDSQLCFAFVKVMD